MDAVYNTLFGLAILMAIVGVYFLPTILAADRKVPNFWSVAVINVLLGWTLIGWVVALALAVRDRKAAAPASTVTPAAADPGAVERLAQLDELHSRGVLTDDEFASAKARVLEGSTR